MFIDSGICSRSLASLYLNTFIGFCVPALICAVVPPMLSTEAWYDDNGEPLSIVWIGITLGLYPLGQFFGSPLVGYYADYYTTRRVLLVSLSVGVLIWVLIYISVTECNFEMFCVFLFLSGFCESNTTLTHLVIADELPVHKHPRALSFMLLMMSMGFTSGSFLTATGAITSFSLPFVILGGGLLFNLCFAFVLFQPGQEIRQSPDSAKLDFPSSQNETDQVSIRSEEWRIYMLTCLVCFAGFGFMRNLPLFLVYYWGMEVTEEALHITLANFVFACPTYMYIYPKLSKLLSSAFLMQVFMPMSGILQLYCILSNPLHSWILVLTAWLNYVPISIYMSAVAKGVNNYFQRAHDKGRKLGYNQSVFYVSGAMAAFVGGLAMEVHPKLSMLIFALVSLISVGFLTFGLAPDQYALLNRLVVGHVYAKDKSQDMNNMGNKELEFVMFPQTET